MDSPTQVPHGFSVRYRLGSGQTSNVWLALHASLGNVALKLPRPEVQDKPVLRRMFENEVQITLSLRHPNIVAGYAGMPTGPGAYLALEYCAGGTLEDRKSIRLNSSHVAISYAVFCLKKKTGNNHPLHGRDGTEQQL